MRITLLSSLAKVFPDEVCGGYEITRMSCLSEETATFIIAAVPESDGVIRAEISHGRGEIFLSAVESVPVGRTAPDSRDEYFLRGARPGMYPDLLSGKTAAMAKAGEYVSFFAEYSPSDGDDELVVTLTSEKESAEARLPVRVIKTPERGRTLMCTHWFHSDCIADHYGVSVFSPEHKEYIRKFMRCAVKHGINTILTPLFTPPLDTAEGHERPTVQLVDVYYDGENYAFGLDRLREWIETAFAEGFEYVEFSHLFTQWGAKHAPKIIADTPEGKKQIFGWKTGAHGKAYTGFLTALAGPLKALIREMDIGDKVMFHTSDEPGASSLVSYRKASRVMRELFGEYKMIDALSDLSFYKKGLIDTPVPSVSALPVFYGQVPELWTYYCCGPADGSMPNRFMAMPSLRNRILGIVMYIYDVKGFLQWGYNFYYTQLSLRKVDPFTETDAGGAFPSGDAFVVYPGKDGEPLPSLRLKVFRDGLDDYEALRLLETLMPRGDVIKMLGEGLPYDLDERHYPHSEEWLIKKREQINASIEALLS